MSPVLRGAALRLLGILALVPSAGQAQRKGMISTFGDSMKITNGFSFTADGRMLLTSEREAVGKAGGRTSWRMFTPTTGQRQLATSLFVYDIEAGSLRNRRRLSFANDTLDYYPLLSHDERRIFFNSRRPVPRPDTTAARHVHIWYSERTAGGWGPARYAEALNHSGASSQYAQQLADSSVMFSSNRPGSTPDSSGVPTFDLWEARWRNGRWEPPVNLRSLNTAQGEEGSFVDRTGRILFFKRNHDGESHVFLSIRAGGEWRTPRQVHLTDLGGFDEHSPRVSADGERFYFANGLTMMDIALDALLTAEERRVARGGR